MESKCEIFPNSRRRCKFGAVVRGGGGEVEVTGAAECNDPIIRSRSTWSTRINGREGSLDCGEWDDGQHPGPGFLLAGHSLLLHKTLPWWTRQVCYCEAGGLPPTVVCTVVGMRKNPTTVCLPLVDNNVAESVRGSVFWTIYLCCVITDLVTQSQFWLARFADPLRTDTDWQVTHNALLLIFHWSVSTYSSMVRRL